MSQNIRLKEAPTELHFTTVGTVDAKGKSIYSFTDVDVPSTIIILSDQERGYMMEEINTVAS